MADVKEERLAFSWPETGDLEVLVKGNESATLRFDPSEEAIREGLRKCGVEAAHERFLRGIQKHRGRQ